MTNFQRAQLLHKHLTGDFKFRNNAGNAYPREAFCKMLNNLIALGFIDKKSAEVLPAGAKFCDENHLKINLSILD